MAKKDNRPGDKASESVPGSPKWWQRLFPARGPKPPEQRQGELQKSIKKLGLEFSTPENVLEEDERLMIHGVVELGETAVEEVMVPRVEIVGIPAESALADAVTIIGQTGHSRFPLYRESLDNIEGILYAKDLLIHAFEKDGVDLRKIARKPYFIPENIKLDILLRELKRKRLHIAIVVDEYGGTSGLVTMEDILEEIVGEIEDEYDVESAAIVKETGDTFLVTGSVTIADLNDEAGLNLPEEEFETVGGLIYDLVGSLPEKGRAVKYHGITFVVDEVEGQRIVKVRVTASKKKSSNGAAR
jgi:CBS domain containing-hemolysin-like protein